MSLEGADQRDLYVAIGIDCDPDRDTYPWRLTWRGVEALSTLFDIPDVRWTFNVRADTQIRAYCGAADYCWRRYRDLWTEAVRRGDAIAWHLHYFGRDGLQDTSDANVLENIQVGTEALDGPDIVHMGWTYQSEFSIQKLAACGVRIDYSPVPRVRGVGRSGVDAQDWWRFAYRPQRWHGVRMIPAFSFRHRLLARRFRSERLILMTTTTPLLFDLLLDDFFDSGSDFLVSYFHADEIATAVGGWRNRLYSRRNLMSNIESLRARAAGEGHRLRFVTVRELARVLFDENHPRHA